MKPLMIMAGFFDDASETITGIRETFGGYFVAFCTFGFVILGIFALAYLLAFLRDAGKRKGE